MTQIIDTICEDIYYCYLIYSPNLTYIGITNNLAKRLETHNSGKGSKYTRKRNNWEYFLIVGTFDKSTACQFEWYWKHEQVSDKFNRNNKWIRSKSGLQNKINRLNLLLTHETWKKYKLIFKK